MSIENVLEIIHQGIRNMREEGGTGAPGQVVEDLDSSEVIIRAAAAQLAGQILARESGGDGDSVMALLLVGVHSKADTEFVRTWERAYARIYADLDKDESVKGLVEALERIVKGDK